MTKRVVAFLATPVTKLHLCRNMPTFIALVTDLKKVGGSFSARVPRSSAELHRGFVQHILEDEVDWQKEEQGDQREEDEEEKVNGDVEAIRETHNNNAQMTMHG